MSLPKLLQVVLIVSLIPAAAYAVATATHSPNRSPASMGLATLSIVADGNATTIGQIGGVDEVMTPVATPPSPPAMPTIGDTEMRPPAADKSEASISISATVIQRNSSAVIAYNLTSSSLKIGETEYQIVNGTGIFNQRSKVVVLHATVTAGDWTGILILYGHTVQPLSDPGRVEVTFDSPQSKLASKFFLELKGTLTLG